MYRIGLTGGVGSGKSTVSNYMHTLGIPVIDGDKLAREMRLVATEIVKDKLRAIGKSWGKLSKDVQKEVLDKYVAANEADLKKAAQARLDAVKGSDSEHSLAELGL